MNSAKMTTNKIACFFVIFVVVLISYLALQNMLFHSFSSDSSANTSFYTVTDNNIKIKLQPERLIPTLQVGRARYDNQRILRIYDFYFTGSQWESLQEEYDICFATQSSLERMYWVTYILEKWTGPLSLAIRLISEEEWLIFNFYMHYLTKCHSTFESQVVMHLAVPANLSALKIDETILSQWGDIDLEAIWEKGETCPEAEHYLKYLLTMLPTTDLRKLAYKEYYPQNHMRNIARKGCGTHWTFSADIDIIPRNGMAEMLQQFYTEQKLKGKLCAECAYVIPTFALNNSFPFPESKKKLSELFWSGAAQQFYIKDFPPGQGATEYKYWTSSNLDNETVTISHQVNQTRTKLELYEPFYISSDTIEPFDERFVGYGYDRSSQFKAAISAGWNFSVLTPVYSIHWGFQTSATRGFPRQGGIGKSVRMEQITNNKYNYQNFMSELECKKTIGTL